MDREGQALEILPENRLSQNRSRREAAVRRSEEMIRHKSSQFQRLRMPSELEQPCELRREPEEDLSSVDESATCMRTGLRTQSGTAVSVEADEDPAANLFPVRAGQSGPLMNFYKRAPSLCLLTFKMFPGLPW